MIIDEQRTARGLRTVSELLELAESGTIILDPYSVLLGTRVAFGTGNVLYPGVVIECYPDSSCSLGSGNTFLPGTFIAASGGGSIVIGNNNRIGEGGARLMAGGGQLASWQQNPHQQRTRHRRSRHPRQRLPGAGPDHRTTSRSGRR